MKFAYLRKNFSIFAVIIIILACFAAYSNTLSAKFVWDDAPLIRNNPYITSFKYLPNFFSEDIWDIGLQNMTSGYYRPLLGLSFMLDYHFWKMDPFGFHLTNLILHILICLLIFALIEKLFARRSVAFFTALFFGVHPVHTESVSFICGRVDLICLFFMLGSLWLFLEYLGSRKAMLYILSLAGFMAALLVKEMAVIFPFLLIGIDYLCIAKLRARRIIKNTFYLHMGFFLVMGAYLLLRYYFVGWEFMQSKNFIFSNFTYGTSLFWRPFTVLKIIAYYFRVLLFPFNLNADYIFPPANSFFELPVITGLIIVAGLFYLALKCAKKNVIVTFAVFWLFITYFPVSNIIPSGNIFAERYLYIPSIGFCLAVSFFVVRISQLKVKTTSLNWQKSVFLLFILVNLVFLRATFERNKVWRNEFTLWYETSLVSPDSGRAHLNLGNVYATIDYDDQAIEEFNALLHSNADTRWYTYLFNNSGLIYLKKGLNDEAIKAFNIASNLNPDASMVYNNLSTAYGRKGEYKKSIKMALKALSKNPYFYSAHYNLALGYAGLGSDREAIREYKKYLEVMPDDIGVLMAVGHLYYKQGDKEKARQEWEYVLKICKGNQEAKDALKLLKKN